MEERLEGPREEESRTHTAHDGVGMTAPYISSHCITTTLKRSDVNPRSLSSAFF